MPTLKQPNTHPSLATGSKTLGPTGACSAPSITAPIRLDLIETDRIKREDVRKLLSHGLDREERLVVILYYHENMNIREIALTLDLSEQRVKQIRQSLLSRLKAQLRHHGHLNA